MKAGFKHAFKHQMICSKKTETYNLKDYVWTYAIPAAEV